jgi:hypothetical protein
MSPNTYSLTAVSARDERKTIDVTFTNTHNKKIKPFPFFPSFYLPRTSTTPFEKILETISRPPLQIIPHENSTQVICGTWKELKSVAQQIHTNTNYFPHLMEPERQFLLTQNWRYFQTFDEILSPLPETFSNTRVPGLVEELYPTLNAMRTHNAKLEHELCERLVSSHELFLPYTDAPIALHDQLETLLANHLFANHVAVPLQKGNFTTTSTWSHAQRTRANELFSQTPLQGEGKCACCAPTNLFHASLQEGSVVDTRVTQDGVYIHTNNTAQSNEYHETHPGKEKRLARQREFGLSTIPIGPLFRNEKISLALNEARNEIKQGTLMAEINLTLAYWKCTKQPFVLEKIRQNLSARAQVHDVQQNMLTQPYLMQFQLAYTAQLQKDPLVQLHTLAARRTKDWTANLANHLIFHPTAWREATHAQLLEKAVLGA